MVWAACVGMPVREQQRPAVGRAVRGELVDALPRAGVEREMVQPGPEPVVLAGGLGRRLLDDQVRVAETPAVAVRPVLEGLVAEPQLVAVAKFAAQELA